MPPMIPSVPSSIAIPVVFVASGIPLAGFLSTAFGARAAGLGRWGRLGLGVGLGLLAWGGFGVGLAVLKIGWGATYRFTPVLEALAYALPLLIGISALRRAPRLRAAFGSRSGLWRLASIQIFRNLGLVFLILHAQGKLPGLFAYPAAWGDIAVGVSAPIAIWALFYRESEIRRAGSRWRRAFIGWNLFGRAEHVT